MIFGIDVVSILLGGLSAGMVLFIVSVGLSVTMGLMGFVNLAHGAFAMLGGYVIVLSMNNAGLGFAPALALGFIVTAAVSVVFERLFYSRLYRASELDQVLFTIGLVFVFIASITLIVGPESQPLTLPAELRGQINLGFTEYRTYSIFLIVAGAVIMLAIWLGFERTRIGAQIRAAVDNRRMAASLGINIDRLFTITFAFGSGMAGPRRRPGRGISRPRSAIRAQVSGVFSDRRVGGRPRQRGRRVLCIAADRRARLCSQALSPEGRHAVHLRAHYPSAVMAAAGLAREERDMSTTDTPVSDRAPASSWRDNPGARALMRRHRLRWWEPLPWLLAIAFYFLYPNYLGFGTELLIAVLFALSLDLALGYAGIVTLGHAAFFGTGAYTVGLLAFHGIWNEPITSLMLAAAAAAVIGLVSGLVLLRTQGLTLLMLTLCTMALLEEGANMGHDFTGGFDGLPSLPIPPLLGRFEFNPLYANTQYIYSLVVLFVCFVFVRTLVYSPFGQSLTGIRENILRMHAVGSPVRWRLVVCYTISAAIAGVAGGLWAQTNAYVNLSVFGLDRAATVLIILVLGGYGRLYGAFVGAVAYMVLAHFLARIYPTAWQLGLGLLLVVIALFARNGILGIFAALFTRRAAKTPAS